MSTGEGSKERAGATIKVENLNVRYSEVLALRCDRAEFSGGVIGVLGHNGAGKSTFIKTVLGLLQPTTGAVSASFSGPAGTMSLVPERHMAFCPETGSAFADISVESYIKLWCRIKHRDANYFKKAGSKYLELLDLPPLLPKLGRELSKGQRRRVQTAIGFFGRPRLFLFDEPFDGLDVQRSHELTDIIESHRREMAFVISSHRMDVMERLSDFLLVLKDGEFLSFGPVERVCAELGGTTVAVHSRADTERARGILRDGFRGAVLNTIGSRISLTGKDLNVGTVREYLTRNGVEEPDVEEVRPSLVDAMNYHLKT